MQFTSDMNFKATQVRITKWLRWDGTSGDCLVQPPLLKQGQPEQSALGSVLWSGFGYLHAQRLHNFPEQFNPLFDHPHSRQTPWGVFVH